MEDSRPKRAHPYSVLPATVAPMMNTRNAKQKPRTHFEQIPLAVVKKVIDAGPVKPAKMGAKSLIVEAAPTKTEPYSVPAHSIAHADITPKAAGRPR